MDLEKRLFDFKNEYIDAYNQISIDEDGVITGLEALEAIKDDFETKAVNVAKMVLCLRADAKAIGDQKKIYADREKSKEKEADRLADYLKYNLKEVGMAKLETPEISMKLGRETESVDIVDEFKIPEMYMRKKVDTVPDKKLIKEAIKAGVIVEGAQLITNQNVIIK